MTRTATSVIYFLLVMLTARAQQKGRCSEYGQLMKAGEIYIKAKSYRNALNKFNAAKLCLPDSSWRVDERIGAVFTAIEREKDNAILQKQLADTEKKKAQLATQRAQAAYWAGESDKLPPSQAIRLLEISAKYDFNAGPVYERLARRLNETDSLLFNQLDLPHKNSVHSAVFSPDGKWILTGSDDKTTQVWDLKGKSIKKLFHYNNVNSAVFSPNGRWIVTGTTNSRNINPLTSGPTELSIWDLSTNREQTISGESIRSVVFSPDGKWILTASDNKIAQVWDLKGKNLLTLTHADVVNSAEFSPDGKWVLTASDDSTATIWDLNGRPNKTISHSACVNWAGFSPDGKWILTASDGGTARMWDLNGKLLKTLLHAGNVNSAVFSPNGRWILTASDDKTAQLWDLDGKSTKTLVHLDKVNCAVFSPDGEWILTASDDQTAQVWNLNLNPLKTLQDRIVVDSVPVSPDGGVILATFGNRVVANSSDQKFTVWSRKWKRLWSDSDNLWSADFSPDGRKILAVSGLGYAKIWDWNGKPLQTLGQYDRILSAIFSPDGKRILTASADGSAQLWDLNGKPLKSLISNLKREYVHSAEFSPDGKRIVTASEDGTAKLWDLKGKLLRTIFPTGGVYTAEFSPFGRRFLTSNQDMIQVWDLNGNQVQALFSEKRIGSLTANYAPNGNWIRMTNTDEDYRKTIKLWFTAEGALDWLKDNIDKIAPLSQENRMKYGVPPN